MNKLEALREIIPHFDKREGTKTRRTEVEIGNTTMPLLVTTEHTGTTVRDTERYTYAGLIQQKRYTLPEEEERYLEVLAGFRDNETGNTRLFHNFGRNIPRFLGGIRNYDRYQELKAAYWPVEGMFIEVDGRHVELGLRRAEGYPILFAYRMDPEEYLGYKFTGHTAIGGAYDGEMKPFLDRGP